MRLRSLAAGIGAAVTLAAGVVLGRRFIRIPRDRQSTQRDVAQPVAAARPAPAEGAPHPAPGAAATSSQEAPGRLDRLLPLLGTAGLLLTIALVAWSALDLRPPVPAATPSWPFVAALGSVIIWAVYLFWKVPQWQAAARRGRRDWREGALRHRERRPRHDRPDARWGGGHQRAALRLATTWQHGRDATGEPGRADHRALHPGSRPARQRRCDDPPWWHLRAGSDRRGLSPGLRAGDAGAGVVCSRVLPRTATISTPGATGATGPDLPIDVQAVLTILGGRTEPWPAPRCLDLSGADLAFANLVNANLVGICLERTDLANANCPAPICAE